MLSIRSIAFLLILVVGVAGSRGAYAEVERFWSYSSPETSARIGTLRHEFALDRVNHSASVKSFDGKGRLIAELIASHDRTTMRRYRVTAAAPILSDEVVLDPNGKQIELTTTDEKAFQIWTKKYVAEVTKPTAPWRTSKSFTLTCKQKCYGYAGACALSAIGTGFWGELACAAGLFICVIACPPEPGTAPEGGVVDPKVCGEELCSRNEKCCEGRKCLPNCR